MRWLSDLFRLAWGFLYWNVRKSIFRLRGARRKCPCQNVSDSGRAWETGCDAILTWSNPARFRMVCPLLKKNAAGSWCCSVDREAVRPFWGRAFVFYGSIAAVFYLVATIAVFVFLRQVGYRITYPGVVWPPAWSRFTEIRTDFFLRKYQAASQAGDMQTAIMALSTAYALQPENYTAGRQLAQFWQIGQPALSDQIYRRLIKDHPNEAETTAQAWFRALLARGDFPGVESLSAERIVAAPGQAGAWLNAFLFANRRTGNADVRARLLAEPGLPQSARFLISLTNQLASPDIDATQVRALLTQAAEGAPDGITLFNVCRLLIAHGFAQDALIWLEKRPGLVGARDHAPLRLDALAALGWTGALRSEVETLLMGSSHPVLIELLSAHLIRHPSSEILGMVFAQLDRDPLPETVAGYSAYLSLFCAAGAANDEPALRRTAAYIKATLRENFRSLDAIGGALLAGNRNPNRERSVGNYLPALQPLPLEVSYALFEHYDPVP